MRFRDVDKLSENWRFTDDNCPVDDKNFSQYLEKYGQERTLGYLDAIADIRAEIAWVLNHTKPGQGGFSRSASKVQTLLNDFYIHKKHLIESVNNHPLLGSDEALTQKLKQR